jgi:PiT family inorganic phosphate transporter
MGLIMLILIGILPAVYALDLDTSSQALKNLEIAVQPVTEILDKYAKDRPATADEAKDELSAFLKTTGHLSDKTFGAIAVEIQNLQSKLQGKSKFSDVPKEQRSDLRTAIYLVHSSITKLRKQHLITDKTDDAALGLFASGLKSTSVGQSRGSSSAWLRNDDRLETDCCHGGRKDRKISFDLCPGRVG